MNEFNKEATELVHQHIFEALERIEKQGEILDTKVTYTNGKVKRLILAVAIIAAYLAGKGLIDPNTVLTFLAL